MANEALKGFFRIGVFIGGCGFIMILLEPRDSAEFVISVCSALIGLTIMAGVALMVRFDFLAWLERLAATKVHPPDAETPRGREEE